MQQKAQIISTLLHRPELVIVDEPFGGLDPINTQMVKDLLRDQRSQGVTIIMCTHQMNQVEELCDRLVLIDHGRVMLYGELEEIRRRYSGHAVLVRTAGDAVSQAQLASMQGVLSSEPHNAAVRLNLAASTSPQEILRRLVEQNATIEQFEVALPTLDEIFIRVVKGDERE